MKKLIVYRAKPNPAGKDKFHNIPLPRQLQGEWVDLINNTSGKLSLKGVSLDHTAFGATCADRHYAVYWQAVDALMLDGGEILRIHTGKYGDASQMAEEDRNGAHKHVWAEHGSFKLNNGACGDALTLWFNAGAKYEDIDRTSYAPYPPEGIALIREGDKLVVPIRSYYGLV